MAAATPVVICTDNFLINFLSNLDCTFRLENRQNVQVTYGVNVYTKKFLYTPGTNTDPTHLNYGFFVRYDPSPGDPTANPPVPADTDFPGGGSVTITGGFVDESGNPAEPDLSGNLTQARVGYFRGVITIDQTRYEAWLATLSAENFKKFRNGFNIIVTLGFNPGVDVE